MAANIRQKIALLAINTNTEQTMNNYLALGYVIHQIVNLQPAQNSLLIIYYDPAVDEIPV